MIINKNDLIYIVIKVMKKRVYVKFNGKVDFILSVFGWSSGSDPGPGFPNRTDRALT